jgi:membrane fusion protein (multidrug efflux system)
MRRMFYFLLVTVLLGGLAAGIAFWSFYALPAMIAQSIQSAPAPVQTVSAEEAKSENWQPEIAGIGTLTASEGIDIAPQVGGVVTEISFESGATVKKGDKLVQLDTATDEADLKNLQVQLANAEEELRGPRRPRQLAHGPRPTAGQH